VGLCVHIDSVLLAVPLFILLRDFGRCAGMQGEIDIHVEGHAMWLVSVVYVIDAMQYLGEVGRGRGRVTDRVHPCFVAARSQAVLDEQGGLLPRRYNEFPLEQGGLLAEYFNNVVRCLT
jgi:hypothetical protein